MTVTSPTIIDLGALGAENHPEFVRQLLGFVTVYQEAFREEPWNEHHLACDVHADVVVPHLDHCILALAADDQVVGIASAHPALADMGAKSSTKRFLEVNRHLVPFDLDKTIYMSELAVLSAHRRQGHALRLTEARMEWAKRHGYETFLMRTAEKGSLSKELYMNRIDSAFMIGSLVEDVTGNGIATDCPRRIYIGGYLP